MSAKRILHMIDTGGPGGAETIMAILATEWPDLETEHFVIVGRDDWLSSRLRKAKVKCLVVDATGRFSIRYLRALLTIVRDFQPDVIVSHLLGSNTYGCVVSIISRIPIICVFHGPTDIAGGRILTALKMWLIDRFADSIVYVSDALARNVKQRFPMARSNSLTIHNGTQISEQSASTSPAGRDEHKAFVVGCIGNLRPAKNYQMLLRVARIVKNQRLNVLFRVFGHQRKDVFDELLPLARRLDVEDSVQWMGYSTDTAAELATFDAFAITSSSEGIPLALLEAMAQSVPVVSTEVGGIPEVVVNGETGFLVGVNDDELFAARLMQLRADPELRYAFGAAGFEHVREYFSIAQMTNRYAALAKSLAE